MSRAFYITVSMLMRYPLLGNGYIRVGESDSVHGRRGELSCLSVV
ncbi:MAG: hypothetical protein ACSHXK_01205 [Oceanococcus sp.]